MEVLTSNLLEVSPKNMQTTLFLKPITRSNKDKFSQECQKKNRVCKTGFAAKFQVAILQLGAMTALQRIDSQNSY